MNKLVTIILFFCFSRLPAQAPGDTVNLHYFLEKYQITHTDPLLILSINPNECQKYKLAISLFRNKMHGYGVEDHLIYLIKGLRKKEANYFMQNELNLPPDKLNILLDDEFCNFLNRNGPTSVILISKGKIVSSYTIYEAMDKLSFREDAGESYSCVLKDSVLMEEPGMPFSKITRPRLLDENKMLLLNYRYNSLSVYDITSGKKLKDVDLTYDSRTLYKQISSNPQAIDFAGRGKSVVSKYNMREMLLDNVIVHNNKVYITCSFLFASREGAKDTVLTSYPFLIITTPAFEQFQFHNLNPAGAHGYYIQPNNNFYVENDSLILFNMIAPSDSMTSKRKLHYLGEFECSGKNEAWKFHQFMPVNLPDYFRINHLNYTYNNNDFLNYDHKLYSYFLEILPWVRAVDGKEKFDLPDSTYIPITAKEWADKRTIDYITVAAQEIPDKRIAFVIRQKDTFELLILDGKNKKTIYRHVLPYSCFKDGRVVMTDKLIYVFNPSKDNAYLYRFSFHQIPD
jgi:hypothetical protein